MYAHVLLSVSIELCVCVCVRVFVSAEKGDERAEKKPKSVEERLEHLESIKQYLPEAKYNQKIEEILKDV